MKTKSTFYNLISIVILGVFIALSLGSIGGLAGTLIGDLLSSAWDFNSDRTEDGTKTETKVSIKDNEQYTDTKTGKTDNKGRWHGPFERNMIGVVSEGELVKVSKTLEVNMINGKKHGIGIVTTTIEEPPSTKKDTVCYDMDLDVDCDDFDPNRTTDTTAFFFLKRKYYDYLTTLWVLTQDEDYIKSYMDTLEKIIGSYAVDIDSFDNYYSDALEELSNTFYDSLTLDNNDFTIFHLLDLMKNGQFRLAVFDSYLKDIYSTYHVISDYYPDYLLYLQGFEISEHDFEDYCHVFDSLLTSYGPLDTEEYSFPDSLDDRIFRAYAEIDSLDQDSLAGVANEYRFLSDNNKFPGQLLGHLGILSDINGAIGLLSFIEFYYAADIIQKCQREAYYLKNEFVDYPVVTTALKEQNSDTEARIQGFVASDGGAEVTKRGILWAQHYNPILDDNQENGGSGTGLFSVTLTGLTPGETYYARSFATNSAGTNVGNCVEFVAQQVTGTHVTSILTRKVELYPNPASDFIDIVFEKGYEIENIVISDIHGNIVLTKPGNRTIDGPCKLNISSLVDGVYLCIFKYKDGRQSVKKLVVAY